MINDTCRCGAKFSVTHKYSCDESSDHDNWLEAHAVCRERKTADHYPDTSVIPPEFIHERQHTDLQQAMIANNGNEEG